MRYFIDHNDMAPVISALGGVEKAVEITNSTIASPRASVVRHIVGEVLAGRATLVYSDTTLETLKIALMRGGDDFRAISEEQAEKSVTLLRVLARSSNGHVSDETVANLLDSTKALVAAHFGYGRGQVDKEDVTVITTAVASVLEQPSRGNVDVELMLISNDGGVNNCIREMLTHKILPMRDRTFLEVVNGKRQINLRLAA